MASEEENKVSIGSSGPLRTSLDGRLHSSPEKPLSLETLPPHTSAIGMVAKPSSVSIFSGAIEEPRSSSMAGSKTFPLSPDATDRVFPVRSVVSVEHTATPLPRRETGDGFPGMTLTNAIHSNQASIRGRASASNTSIGKSTTSSMPRTPPRRQSPGTNVQLVAPKGQCRPQSSVPSSTRSMTMSTHRQINSLLADDGFVGTEGDSGTDGGLSTSSRPASLRSMPNEAYTTARFKHVVTDDGHAVITGRNGETLQRCEDEPIHIPGAIQSFGLLIALREEAGKLVVRVVSENSMTIIGYSPAQLFQLSSFLNILTEEQADNLLDHLDFIRDESAADPAVNGPEVFMLSLRAPGRETQQFWCAMHINDANKDLIICEFEFEVDSLNPLAPADEQSPEAPEDTLGSNPTAEEFAESTVNVSRPLRVLRSARRKKGEAAAMEVFNIMAQVQEQLASASSLEKFLKILAGVVKELTGFHRVMVYQFDHTFNGRVVAELVDPRATKDLYMGLNFPASDIPKQARDLYRINKVRLLYDRDQETARLVCRTMEDLENPLDMTFAYLRAISPVHIKYLTNMAVRSSMSISINAFDELWGLIALHSYGHKGMRVSFPIRKMCRLIGDTASRNIERLSYASRLQARKLINTSCTSANPSGYIVASSEDLLELFSADCGALSIRDETKLLGKSGSHMQEVLAMLEFLRLRKIGSVFSSTDINTDFPDLRYPPGFHFIAGLLFVPLSSSGTDFIVFFRQGTSKEMKWAGNPYEKFVKDGTEGYLEPRKSFKTWSEIIVGRCRDWSEEEIETAASLCLVYGKFIEVWRQKEAALESSQLHKLLLANSAHEVRTPLNAIINYIEIAMEGNLDHDTRDSLSRSLSASKSLVYVINDLLDLTKTEEGLHLVKEEVFDLHVVINEATQPFQGDAQRKSLEYQINKVDNLPQFLVGDPRLIRQIISNVIANAIQNTSTGFVRVCVAKAEKQSGREKVEIEFAIEDSGAGMPQEKVDALFSELEQVSSGNEEQGSRVAERNAVDKAATTDDSKATLGLGLAVVARAIRNMNGQLRLKTEVGKGSCFVIQLVLGVPGPDRQRQIRTSNMSVVADDHKAASSNEIGARVSGANKDPSGQTTTWPTSRRQSQENFHTLHRRSSIQSIQSGNSIMSGKSDVDRLIEDIQKPHLVSDSEATETKRMRRANSRRLNRSNSADGEITRSPNSFKEVIQDQGNLKIRGEERITDSRTPLKAVRIPDLSRKISQDSGLQSASKVAFELKEPRQRATVPLSANELSVLVAEDDPVNSKIIKKRLEKLGHIVRLTVNGEECSSTLEDHSTFYDVVLMDLQMPIVDGFTSTKMIRSFEKSHGQQGLSARARANGRIPIFAVSASLLEKDRDLYIRTGFDGWILKPVNFKRVEALLKGIVEDEVRNDCLFKPGQWEHGGWFEKRQAVTKTSHAQTTSRNEAPISDSTKFPASLPKAETL